MAVSSSHPARSSDQGRNAATQKLNSLQDIARGGIFQPQSAGKKNELLRVFDSTSNIPQKAELQGVGKRP